jgi:hypothetical protein
MISREKRILRNIIDRETVRYSMASISVSDQFTKLATKLLGLLILLAGILLLAGFFPFSHPVLSRYIDKALSAATFDSCMVRSATLTPYKGIVIQELKAIRPIRGQRTIEVAASSLSVDYHPVEILLNRKAFFQGIHSASTLPNGLPLINILTFIQRCDSLILPYIKALSIRNGQLILRSRGAAAKDTVVDGLNFSMAGGNEDGFHILSSLEASSMKLARLRINQAEAEIEVQGDNLYLRKAAANIIGGKARGLLDINLEKRMISSGSISLKKFDLSQAVVALGRNLGTVSGSGDITFDLRSSPLCIQCVRGKGDVTLRDVKLTGIPLLSSVAQKLMLPILNDVSFKQITGDLALTDAEVVCENVKARGELMDIDATGLIEPTGYFKFKVKGTLNAAMKDKVDALVWESMFDGENDKRYFLCTISGTYADPVVVIDKEHVERAMRTVIKSLGKELQDMFR